MKILNLSLVAILSTQCTAPKEEEVDKDELKKAIPDVGNIMIDLPSALVSEGVNLKLSSEDDGGVKGFFLMPVTFTAVAKDMNTLTKDLVEHIFGKAVCTDDDTSNDLADCAEYSGLISGPISKDATVLEIPDSEGGGGPRYLKYWTNPEGSEYDLGLELYFATADGYYVPALQMQLSKTDEKLGKGEFKFFPSLGEPGEGLESIITTFAATTEKRTLDVQVYFSTLLEGPSSLGLAVTEKDGIVTGAGTAIRLKQDGVEGPFAPFQKNQEYAFVWTLAADSVNNLAVEKFAAVSPIGYADSDTYFTSYGVDSLLRNFALDLLRTDESGFDCAAYGQIIDPTLPTNICYTNSAVTDTQVLNSLKTFCTADPSNGICEIAGQTSNWANPVYMNADGYVGNENFNKPSDAKYAPLVQALGALKVYTPMDFKILGRPPLPAAADSVN